MNQPQAQSQEIPFAARENSPEWMRTRETPRFQDAGATEEDLVLINQIAPIPLQADQVYIRSMFLCSTQPCPSDGCRFTRNALEEIARLVIGQSVLTGHDRSSLPLARFFKAIVLPRGTDEDGEPIFFVRAWFYWLRETTGAKDLLLNIDGGIYREVSLAWKYNSWTCSICQAENGQCGHRVGELIEGKKCSRLIHHVTEVLEGSLVYKSADRNTLLTGHRAEYALQDAEPLILICENDDPLLQFLKTNQCIGETREPEEWASALQEGGSPLWVRSRPGDDVRDRLKSWLSGDGICLLETVPDADRDVPGFGETEVIAARDLQDEEPFPAIDTPTEE